MLRIRKNDRVIVIAGKDKGKIGKVLRVFPEQERVLVEKVNIIKKARRKRSQQDQQSGIIEYEAPIHITNVMIADKRTDQPTRVKVSVLKDGTKVRMTKKSDEAI